VLLIYFISALNDVQNPHVSVLKIYFMLSLIGCHKTGFGH
jgi:hypothetical protein